jgi:hypothetical protein
MDKIIFIVTIIITIEWIAIISAVILGNKLQTPFFKVYEIEVSSSVFWVHYPAVFYQLWFWTSHFGLEF